MRNLTEITAKQIEREVHDFWNANPCREHQVGNPTGDLKAFFHRYDEFRYSREPHVLKSIASLDVRGKRVLEIGLGLGADSEQLIRRGAVWSGIDLTPASVERVRRRLEIRGLPYEKVQCASALSVPFSDGSFDLVFSHGVLHHIPEIKDAGSSALLVQSATARCRRSAVLVTRRGGRDCAAGRTWRDHTCCA